MKKLIALILALAMVFVLAACSQKPSASLGARPDPTAPSLDSKPRNTEPDTEPTETTAPIEDTEPPETTAATEDTTPANYGDTLHIQETVIFDQDGIRATVQEQDLSSTFHDYELATISITIENTTDAVIDFTLFDDVVSIDNYLVSAWFFETVEAGESVTGELELDCDDLYLLNVSAPKNFTAAFYAFDDETYDTLTEGSGTFSTDAPDPSPAALSSDGILFSDYDITVAGCGLYEMDDGDCIYFMQIQNNRDGDIFVDLGDLSVNGQDIDEWDYISVYANSIAICRVNMYGYELEEVGLDFDTITDMDFTLEFDTSDFDDIAEAPISVTFE